MNRTTDGHATGNGVAQKSDARLAQALEEYRGLLEAGERPNRAAFLARHMEIADELAECLSGLEFVHAVGPALSGAAAESAAAANLGAGMGPGALGDFRIIREVGRGGMGIVYEAEQLSLSRRVALKVLPFAATMDPRHLQRFHNEARAAAGLHHTNIVPVFAVGCERSVHFYAMQFIEGQTLAAVIAEMRQRSGQAPFPADQPTAPHVPGAPSADTVERAVASTERPALDATYFRRVAEWGIQAAEALDFAHQMGVVHRDVKPANLLVDGDGRLWVTDFGLAQFQSDVRLTMTGDLVGTLRYMSPEQALAQRIIIDQRTDVYSLGATLYELLTLQPVFTGHDRQELLRQIAFEEPKPPRRLNKAIPADLETIVLKAMEKKPTDRYATANELADDLERYRRDEPIRGRRPSLVRRLRKWARRHRSVVVATVICLLTALATGLGSLGWVLGERTTRQHAAESKLAEELDEAGRRLQQSDPYDPVLIATVHEAQTQVDTGAVGPELQGRVRQLWRNLDMLTRLEEAQLQAAAGGKQGWDFAGADRLFTEAFRGYGLDVTFADPDKAAQQVRLSPIREQLIAGMDNWAFARERLQKGSGAPQAAVAHRADDDLWRQRLRQAVAGDDQAALEKLAKEPAALRQPMASILLLSRHLRPGPREEFLQAAQQYHPADFWMNFELALALDKKEPPDYEQAIGFYRAAVALRPQSPAVHNNLGWALSKRGRLDDAVAEYREAIRIKPDLEPIHSNLGIALDAKGQLDEAIAEYREAIRLNKDFAFAHLNLGSALMHKGQLDEAIAELREAARKKDYALAHYGLGRALKDKGQVVEAIAEFRTANRIDPDNNSTFDALAGTLIYNGQLDETIAECREAIRLKKHLAPAHSHLGSVLCLKGQLDNGIAELREAIRLNKDYAGAHSDLGGALYVKGQLDEAIAEFHEAIRLNKDYADPHCNLGQALSDRGQQDEAIAEFREAIRLNKDFPEALCLLGRSLCEQGRFAEGLTIERRGHELGSKRPRWPYQSAQWVKQCERCVELDAKLPRVLKGEILPADVSERLELARLCQQYKSSFAAASRFYADAFAEQPKLANDLNNRWRYKAACAAALAGCGQGHDVTKVPDKVLLGLRRQALEWLRADLVVYRRLLNVFELYGKPINGPDVREWLQHWQKDNDFAGVRGETALAKLPEAERQQWQKLWAEVADTLARAEHRDAPAKEPAPK